MIDIIKYQLQNVLGIKRVRDVVARNAVIANHFSFTLHNNKQKSIKIRNKMRRHGLKNAVIIISIVFVSLMGVGGL